MELFKIFGTIAVNSAGAREALDDFTEEARSTAEQADNFFTRAGNGFEKVGKALTNSVTKPALVAGAAMKGLVLFKGWNRMVQLDQAKQKMIALGYSTEEVSSLTEALGNQISKTAYALDETLTVASSAMAAGVKQGEQLEKHMAAIMDFAAVSNSSLEEIGYIMNQVASAGSANNEQLKMLETRGIPIYQWLAEEAGVTKEEIQAMARSGKVDMEMLENAIENHIGGAAEKLGDATVSGALRNVYSYLGKLGQALLGTSDDATTFAGSLLEMIHSVENTLISLIEPFEEVGHVIGTTFGLAYAYLKDGTRGLHEYAKSVDTIREKSLASFEKMQPFLDTLKSFGEWFGSLSAKAKAAFAIIPVAIGPTLSIVGKLLKVFGAYQAWLGKLTVSGSAFARVFSPRGLGIIGLVSAFAMLIAWMMKTNASASDVALKVRGFVENIANFIVNLSAKLPTILTTIFNALAAVVPQLIPTIFEALTGLINGLLESLPTLIPAILQAVGNMLLAVIQQLPTILYTGLASAFNILPSLLSSVFGVLMGMLYTLGASVVKVFTGIRDGIVNKINEAKNRIKSIIDVIKGLFKFKVSLPHIPMPHFSIKPAGWKLGDLLKGSVPSLGVKWYAKAMENPQILNGAQIFGAANGQLLGGGEAGAEVVSGADKLMRMISEAVASRNTELISALRTVFGEMNLSVTIPFDIDGKRFATLNASNTLDAINKIQTRNDRLVGVR